VIKKTDPRIQEGLVKTQLIQDFYFNLKNILELEAKVRHSFRKVLEMEQFSKDVLITNFRASLYIKDRNVEQALKLL
jgi:hypothetical protein